MTEKQKDMKYLHKYNTISDFDNDYNGEYYHEPWVSISPKLTVTALTMRDEFVYSEGATWEYECERDAVDALNGVPGPMGTRHVYEWTWYDAGSMAQLHAATLVRNPSVGTQIYESGENDGEWFFNSQLPSEVLTVSGTPSEHLEKVTYNKRPEGQPDLEAYFDTTCGIYSDGCRVDYEHANPDFGIYEEVYHSTSEGESEGECDRYYEYYASGTGINVDNLENFKMKFWVDDNPYEFDMVRSSGEEYVPGTEAYYWPTNFSSDFNVYVWVSHFNDDVFIMQVYYHEAG